MKKLLFLTAGLILSISLYSQAPELFNYQAVVRNADGTAMANESVSVQISILHESIDGTPVYTETHNTTTSSLGIVAFQIGAGTTTDDIASIDWGDGEFFLEVKVDGTALGTSQLLSVPYALHAKVADSVMKESQTLSISGNLITISNGNTISLPGNGSSSLPIYTNAQIAALSPAAGDALYNSSEGLYQIFNGTNWVSFPANCWPQPTKSDAGDDQTVADGTVSTTLMANTPETGHGSGEWSILSGNGGSFVDATNPGTTFTGQASTAYELQWTITTTCGSSVDKVIIDFNQNPGALKADFEIYTNIPGDNGDVSVETDIVFIGEEVEFYNSSDNASTYRWEFDDDSISELQSPTYTYDVPGTYSVKLIAFGPGSEVDTCTKDLQVVEGVNSALRITVQEYYDLYPVEGASVLLYGSSSDWETQTNPSEEKFTTPLGKCVFEGLNNQQYYVDVWEVNHDNYTLAGEDIAFIETQQLEPGYIHDFIAFVDVYASGKKIVFTRIGKKEMARKIVAEKNPSEFRKLKRNKFTRKR